MADDYERTTALTSSAEAGEAVDIGGGDHIFTKVTKAIYVGTAGTVMVIFKRGDTPVAHKCAAGTILPVRARGIAASGTDAGDMVGWFD